MLGVKLDRIDKAVSRVFAFTCKFHANWCWCLEGCQDSSNVSWYGWNLLSSLGNRRRWNVWNSTSRNVARNCVIQGSRNFCMVTHL